MLAIYHPVGSHANETLAQIITRKQQDIANYGFALWSFASMRKERVNIWQQKLESENQYSCYVICAGEATKDPTTNPNNIRWLTQYSIDQTNWINIPSNQMVSYHRAPRKNGIVASAFIIDDIIIPNDLKMDRCNQWFSVKDNRWINSTIPTRGEYLIEHPPTSLSPKPKVIKLLLHLKSPFISWVK